MGVSSGLVSPATENEALFAPEEFSEKWNAKYPIILESWTANWQKISPVCRFPQEVRRAIYTANVIESLNFSLRKITKTRAAFPSEKAAMKLIWLGLQDIERKNGQCRFRTGIWQCSS